VRNQLPRATLIWIPPHKKNPEAAKLAEIFKACVYQKTASGVLPINPCHTHIDEIILQASTQEICALFEAERLTLYAGADDGNAIVSSSGLNEFKEINRQLTPTALQRLRGICISITQY
jgi:hypothetical protein